MTLIFSYEELFGASPEELPIRITDEEIERLRKRYEVELAKESEPAKPVAKEVTK